MNPELEAKVAEYYSITPRRFMYVKSITLTQGIDIGANEMRQNLSIAVSDQDSLEGNILHLELLGVRNLKIEQPAWSLITISNLEIAQAPLNGEFDRRLVALDPEEGFILCSFDDFNFYVDNT